MQEKRGIQGEMTSQNMKRASRNGSLKPGLGSPWRGWSQVFGMCGRKSVQKIRAQDQALFGPFMWKCTVQKSVSSSSRDRQMGDNTVRFFYTFFYYLLLKIGETGIIMLCFWTVFFGVEETHGICNGEMRYEAIVNISQDNVLFCFPFFTCST